MAIGLGLMFGIVLPVNFDSPYKATSIIDFWRRWHITLSLSCATMFTSRSAATGTAPVRRYVNIMLTMLLGGLWHGANWTFVPGAGCTACSCSSTTPGETFAASARPM